MKPNTRPLERAFELARSGKFKTVEQIRKQLWTEGYMDYQINGLTLGQQLRKLMKDAQNESSGTAV